MSTLETLYRKDMEEMDLAVTDLPRFVKEDVMDIIKVKNTPGFSWSTVDLLHVTGKVTYLLTSLKIAVMSGELSPGDAEIVRAFYSRIGESKESV